MQKLDMCLTSRIPTKARSQSFDTGIVSKIWSVCHARNEADHGEIHCKPLKRLISSPTLRLIDTRTKKETSSALNSLAVGAWAEQPAQTDVQLQCKGLFRLRVSKIHILLEMAYHALK